MARHAFELEGLDDPLGRNDLANFAPETKLIAVGVAADEAPVAARAEIHVTRRHCRASRPPPLGDVLRPGECLEDEVAREVEFAREDDLLIRRQRHLQRGAVVCDHDCFSFVLQKFLQRVCKLIERV